MAIVATAGASVAQPVLHVRGTTRVEARALPVHGNATPEVESGPAVRRREPVHAARTAEARLARGRRAEGLSLTSCPEEAENRGDAAAHG